MATQIVTFPSDSGTAITPERPDVRLVIPNDGAVYDLSQSRVRITLETSGQNSALYPGNNVIDRRLQFNGPTANSFPVGRESFIRHVKVSDQKHGVVDVRRYNNTLMSTLNEYQRSRFEKITSGVFDTYAGNIDNNEVGGFFVQKHVYGTTLSAARAGVLDVPLSDLTDLARVSDSRLWPTSFTGETVFELEMEPYTSFVADAVGVSANFRPLLICTNAAGTLPTQGETQFLTVESIDYDACPFYVGMPVVANYSQGQTSRVEKNTITAIVRPSGGGANGRRLLITLNTPIANQPTTNVSIRAYTFDSGSAIYDIPPPATAFSYVRVELQMVRVMSGAMPAAMTYMSYRLRDLSASDQQDYTTTIQVPSDRTPNVLVLWKNSSTLQSTEPNVTGYRFSVNDEYESPPIAFRSSQHQEMIVRGFRNAGMTLRDVQELLPSAVTINSYNAAVPTSLLKLIMAPLPIRPPGEPESVVQLEITYGTVASRRLLIYAQQISMLQLREIGVESGTGPAF